MTPTPTIPSLRGEVFYDAGCGICSRGARRWGWLFERRGFRWLPLQTPGTPERTGASEAELREEMKIMLADGRVVGGADAWAILFRSVWWLWPLGFLISLPGIRILSATAYRWIARNRSGLSRACAIPNRNPMSAWLPLVLLSATAILIRKEVAGWIFMWALAFALYAGCKWLVYCEAIRNGAHASSLRATGFLLGWVGMDAKTFLTASTNVRPVRLIEWLSATAKTLLGAALIWLVPPHILPAHELLIGWTGMVGVIFLLHFGLFHLLALAWRTAGVNATPLMQNPLQAAALSEFWGRRWNSAFHELVHRFTFRPLARYVGAIGVTSLVFLISGLIHELVISGPARGGYGLPTGYFLLQGLGIVAEHTWVGRRIGLGHGWVGWLFTMVVTVTPAFWLFHPTFIHHIILPMLKTIGAT